jgi:hypothetical protein
MKYVPATKSAKARLKELLPLVVVRLFLTAQA